MKVLKKHHTMLHYLFEPEVLDENVKSFSSWGTVSTWKPLKDNIYTLTYDTSFFTKEHVSDKCLIDYLARLRLDCVFENIEDDAVEIMKLKEKCDTSMGRFLEQNSMFFFNLSKFPHLTFFRETDIRT